MKWTETNSWCPSWLCVACLEASHPGEYCQQCTQPINCMSIIYVILIELFSLQWRLSGAAIEAHAPQACRYCLSHALMHTDIWSVCSLQVTGAIAPHSLRCHLTFFLFHINFPSNLSRVKTVHKYINVSTKSNYIFGSASSSQSSPIISHLEMNVLLKYIISFVA